MAYGIKVKNVLRKTLQWGTFGLLAYMVVRWWVDPNYLPDFEAFCPFGGLQAFNSFLVNNSLACTMTEMQIFMGVVLFVGVLLFSKLFCSFICPIGTFTEWMAKLGAKFKVLITLKGLPDKLLRGLKYALLFVTVYFTTTSSELFCKEYDPFYAIFTGFGHDVYLWYALAAILLTVVGSIFIRQFWCKYLCPLGAISNIFSNGVMFAGVLALFFLLRWFGLEISWLWPAGVISVLGFVLESWRLEGWIFPVSKITRNESSCTNCAICDLACPMGLDIATVDTVKHIDCHLCGDCLEVCPVEDTLQINKKNIRWMPAAATVALIAIGLFLASTIELPTINMKWGNEQQLETASVFSQSGLKSVKCYGSSMSFASKMRRLKGVVGVETFVQSHTVKVFYDSSKLKPASIQKAIFTPSRTILRRPGKEMVSLSVLKMGIGNLFDSYYNFYFSRLLAQMKGVYGFSTTFGEPVPAKIYFDADKTNPAEIKAALEQRELTYSSRGKETTVEVDFEAHILSDSLAQISPQEFAVNMFAPFNQAFNGYKKYMPDEISVYELPMPQAANPKLRRSFSYLVSHISTDDNLLRFQTLYKDGPYARVFFVKGKISPDSIYATLQKPMLTVHYSNGKTGQVKNPFKFPRKGKIIQ